MLLFFPLIVAVIPDPVACLGEAERVVKPNGRVVVFDTFLAGDSVRTLFRKMMGMLARFLFSDINRKFSRIQKKTQLELIYNEPATLKGTFRYILLKRR